MAALARLPLWLHLAITIAAMFVTNIVMRVLVYDQGFNGGYWTGLATMLVWGFLIGWRAFR